MFYSAIIEIIGIKELAEDDLQIFFERTKSFQVIAEQSITKVISNVSNIQIEVFIFSDHCYVQCNDINALIEYIKIFRITFFETDNYFFRSVITTGKLNIEQGKDRTIQSKTSTAYGKIRFMEYDKVATKLFAMKERFKGIGILIDADDFEKNNIWKKLKSQTFTNFYIIDVVARKYQSFVDISLSPDDIIYSKTKEVFIKLYYDKVYSKKLARFYIPLLINLSRHFDLKSIDRSYDFSFNNIINKSIVLRNKDVTGFEFFYFMLIDRLFDINYTRDLKEAGLMDELNLLELNLAKNTWLIELLRNDSKFSDIPKEILSNSKRRLALRKITEILRELDK